MSKRTKIESRECPSCGANLEVREDLSHGIMRCPYCGTTVNMFIEEPIEEEKEYDSKSGKIKKERIKYSSKGAFSQRVPFLPTTGFRKVPQEYEKESMSYVSLKKILNYIDKIKSADDIKNIERSFQELLNFDQSGQPTYEMGKDIYQLSTHLGRAKLYSIEKRNSLDETTYNENKEVAEEAFELAKRYKQILEEKISKAEDQLGRNKKDYESRLEVYSRVVTIIALIGSGFFLFPNLTGNTIANLSINITSFIGSILLIIGLITLFFFIKIKNKESFFKKKKKK